MKKKKINAFNSYFAMRQVEKSRCKKPQKLFSEEQ